MTTSSILKHPSNQLNQKQVPHCPFALTPGPSVLDSGHAHVHCGCCEEQQNHHLAEHVDGLEVVVFQPRIRRIRHDFLHFGCDKQTHTDITDDGQWPAMAGNGRQ